MCEFFASDNISSCSEEVNIADERPDRIWKARVIDVGCMDPEAIAKFGVAVRWLRKKIKGACGYREAVQLADFLNTKASCVRTRAFH